MSTPSKSLIGLSSALVALILALFSAFFWLDRRVDAHRYAHADTNGYAYCDGDAHTHHRPDATARVCPTPGSVYGIDADGTLRCQ